MRILHIIPSLKKGGAERLCLDICIALKKIGHDVRIITFSSLNEYKYLSNQIDWHVVPSAIKLSLYRKNEYSIKELQIFIEEFSPKIIHSHLFEAEIVSRVCNYPDAKWFSHCHDNIVQLKKVTFKTFINKNRFLNFYEMLFLMKHYRKNNGTHFIAISQDTLKFLKINLPKIQKTLLLNAIDFKRFSKEIGSSVNINTLRLINIGSFVNKKNQKFLLEVASYLVEKDVDFELHFYGDGENRQGLEMEVKERFLSNRIFFHGNVDNIENCLWNSDIYVHSANYEPLGLVILEAMAAGLPVITLDGKGNRDLIEDDKNGYIFYDENAELFAEKIIEIWNNKDKYLQLSKYAQDFSKNFDINVYIKKLIKIYS